MPKNPLHFDDEPSGAPDQGPSFADILSQYEEGRRQPRQEGADGRDGLVVAVSPESVFVDIGFKMEGVIELAAFGGELPKRGDSVRVNITGRNDEGYYTLSKIKVARPKDFSALEKAFQDKAKIGGVVTGLVKGGLTVDIGVRAFMPASRRSLAESSSLMSPKKMPWWIDARCSRKRRRKRASGCFPI
jgi:small subunit ribosomal protein S1